MLLKLKCAVSGLFEPFFFCCATCGTKQDLFIFVRAMVADHHGSSLSQLYSLLDIKKV